MKNIFYIVLFVVLYSAPISEINAIRVAKNVLYERSGVDRSKLILDEFIELGAEPTNLYLVKFSKKGFAIISADDRVFPILGYSIDNTIDIENLPIQLIKILESWQQGIRYLINSGIDSHVEVELEWQKYLDFDLSIDRNRNILPLIAANWDQGGSWNDMCPSNALVGCVAVSMAQIMYFWKYPENGVGLNSYYHNDYGDISVDFSFSSYNYENMQDNQATIDSQLLLYDSGVSVNMDYGPNASGAYVVWGANSAINALVDHFQYNEDISAIYKSDYNETQWDDLLKNELDQSRPIIMRAYDDDSGGGHAWNIDGYQGGNHFHCNWGWGGNSNGYFYLNNLNAGGYNFIIDQAAIINIQPVHSGCTDIYALNYDPLAQIEDGTCFWELTSPQDVILLNKGNNISVMFGYDLVFYPEIISDDENGNFIFTIKIKNINHPVAGFQFQLNSNNSTLNHFEINDIYGGIAEDNNFLLQEENNIILGFSFSGDVIPVGENDLLNISATYNPNTITDEILEIAISDLTDIVFSDYLGNNLRSLFMPANFKYKTSYSELNFNYSCGDGVCSQLELDDCFIDCNNIGDDIQYTINQNENFISYIPRVDNYIINNLVYDTEYCYDFQSFYNGQYSDFSESFCINTGLPPQIGLNSFEFNYNLELNEMITDTFTIINFGESILEYDIVYDTDIQISSNFIGEYFSSPGTGGSPDFGDLIFTREDDLIDFNWGNGSPNETIPDNDFQIRWAGNIFVENSGQYNFRSYTDDGVRLYIDNNIVIDHWLSQAPTSKFGDIYLEAGYHELVMEYYEDGGGAVAQLFWTPPSSSESLVYPTENGWFNLNQYQGQIYPGDTQEIIISLQTDNLNIGSYYTDLNIYSNDPFSAILDIPINLEVGIPDCYGIIGGDAFVDECGICSGGSSGHDANSDQDCNGICFGEDTIDECGICSGDNSECSGCTDENANNYDSNAIIDDASCQYIGDINIDGEINITDIVISVYLVLENEYDQLADINFDSMVNVVDIVLLVEIILN